MSYVWQRAENELGKLEIIQDELNESPRTSYDNLGTMVCWHRDYSLGDKHDFKNVEKFMEFLLEETYGDSDRAERKMDELNNHLQSNSDIYTTILSIAEDKFIILPLYLYDHSGITMRTTSFSCPWDSGQVGWIYVSKWKIRQEYNVKRISKKLKEQIIGHLISEVEIYDQYLTGDVYGFELSDSEGNHIDSCWGFYGQDIKENGIIDHIPNEYKCLIESLEVV